MGMKPGSWYVTCESDPRWNGNGSAGAVGMFAMPNEVKEHLETR